MFIVESRYAFATLTTNSIGPDSWSLASSTEYIFQTWIQILLLVRAWLNYATVLHSLKKLIAVPFPALPRSVKRYTTVKGGWGSIGMFLSSLPNKVSYMLYLGCYTIAICKCLLTCIMHLDCLRICHLACGWRRKRARIYVCGGDIRGKWWENYMRVWRKHIALASSAAW